MTMVTTPIGGIVSLVELSQQTAGEMPEILCAQYHSRRSGVSHYVRSSACAAAFYLKN